MSKTSGAVQRNWHVPSEFPCCPQENTDKSIVSYAEKLKVGAIFACNNIYESVVFKFAMSNDNKLLYVMCESDSAIKPWTLAKITYKHGLYVHTSLGSFFSKEGAEKQFCIAQGLEWTGGDSIDDYC